jgi:DNA-binding transcriptional LysR family regulator
MDLDLRKLRYFVAVADRLHFGRAANELHIAQPALSRQIRALEQDLGALLFTRDRHGVVLTDAGRQLLADAGPLLASADAVRRRVSVAARGSRRLVVGFRTGIPVIPATRAFEGRHPDVIVDVQRMEWDDQAPMLLDGRVDVGYVRLTRSRSARPASTRAAVGRPRRGLEERRTPPNQVCGVACPLGSVCGPHVYAADDQASVRDSDTLRLSGLHRPLGLRGPRPSDSRRPDRAHPVCQTGRASP